MLTTQQINDRYRRIIASCKEVFEKKGNEYGPTWAVYRWGSLVDQLWIKIKRIRQLENHENRVDEPSLVEYVALVNYAVIFLMRLEGDFALRSSDSIVEDVSLLESINAERVSALYDRVSEKSFELYLAKNHDYNNAWQDMSISSITDMIIVKILRMRHIVSSPPRLEGKDIAEQLYDVINYSVFSLILQGEGLNE